MLKEQSIRIHNCVFQNGHIQEEDYIVVQNTKDVHIQGTQNTINNKTDPGRTGTMLEVTFGFFLQELVFHGDSTICGNNEPT